MMLISYRYEKIKRYAEKRGKCPVCGGSVVRKRVFWQTHNPFNKNEDGTIKSAHEVWLSVCAEADAWVPDFTHGRCHPDE